MDGPRQMLVGVPLGSRVLVVFLLLFAALSFAVPFPEQFFALNPGYTLPPHMRIWNVFTSSFFEKSVLSTIIDGVVAVLAGRFLETSWGTVEFARFIGVTALFGGVASFFTLCLLYACGRGSLWLSADVCGFSGVLTAFVVGAKQIAPDQQHGPLRLKHLPLLFVALYAVFSLAGANAGPLLLSVCGLGSSWAYLRFFQRRAGGARGDRSEAFAFHTFFPEAVQGPFASCERVIGAAFGAGRAAQGSAPTSRGYALGAPGSTAADIERRRVLALKAVDQRLAELKNVPDTPVDVEAPAPASQAPTSPPPAKSEQQPSPQKPAPEAGASEAKPESQ